MQIPEPFLSPLIETIFGTVLQQSGATEWLRETFGRDPVKQAFGRALNRAIALFHAQYPDAEDQLFDASFLQLEAAPILAQFLIRDGHPDPSALAQRWSDSLAIHDPERRTFLNHQLMPAAVHFLELFGQALNAEPDLRDINDSRTLERVAEHLAALRRAVDREQATAATRSQYLLWLINRTSYLDARGTLQIQRQVQVRLDQVYISLQAQREHTPHLVDRRLLQEELAMRQILSSAARPRTPEELEEAIEDMLCQHHAQGSSSAGSGYGESVELADIVNRHDHLVILGDPGSGKTTLTQYLALKHASALNEGRAIVEDMLGPARFPILIRIAAYADNDTWKRIALSDFLAAYCSLLECPAPGLADLLHAELERGTCLVMLDGMDEIVSADARRDIVRRIEEFVRRFASVGNRFVVTSRIAGYRTFPLSEPFAHYTVEELSTTHIQRFLERWCLAVEVTQTPELSPERHAEVARREIDGIMVSIRNTIGVRRMAANPLMLRILALIHRNGARLPQKRIELYSLAADTLTRHWRLWQGVPEAALVLLQDTTIIRLLGSLSYWLHAHKPTGLATEREVKALLGAEWARINGHSWDADEPDPVIERSVDAFLQSVREHTGLFVERAPRRYGFMHLIFEEYYAARYLVARAKTRATLVRQHLHDPRWDEPILLALGWIGMSSPDDISELVETTILAQGNAAEALGFTASSYEALLGRDFLFALRCLGDDIPLDTFLVDQLLTRFVDEFVRRRQSGQYEAYRALLTERFSRLKQTPHVPRLAALLAGVLNDTDVWVRLEAAQRLVELGEHPQHLLDVLNEALAAPDSAVRWEAVNLLATLKQDTPAVLTVLTAALSERAIWLRVRAAARLLELGHYTSDIVGVLIAALGHQDQDAVVEAIQALGSLGTQAPDVVLPDLIVALSHVNGTVQWRTEHLLTDLASHRPDAVVPALRQAMAAGDASMELHVIKILSEMRLPDEEALDLLTGALNHPNPRLRVQAAHGRLQWRQPTPEAVSVLIATFAERDVSVHMNTAHLLTGPYSQSSDVVQAALTQALGDAREQVRFHAAQCLHKLGQVSDQMIAVVAGVLEHPDTHERIQAAKMLIELQHEVTAAAAVLTAALVDANHWTQLTAAVAMLEVGYQAPEAIQVLNTLLVSPDPFVCFQAALELAEGHHPSPGLVMALMSALSNDDNNWLERKHVVRLLISIAEQSRDSVIPQLLAILDDPARPERSDAVTVLAALEEPPPEFLALAIHSLLADPDPQVRWSFATVLGTHAEPQQIVIDRLYAGILDEDHGVRMGCGHALALLGQRHPQISVTLATKLEQALTDPSFAKPDDIDQRPGFEYAFDSLWMLVSGAPSMILAEREASENEFL